MIIKPRIKGFVCITSHPTGCYENVREQAEFAKSISLAPEKNQSVFLLLVHPLDTA